MMTDMDQFEAAEMGLGGMESFIAAGGVFDPAAVNLQGQTVEMLAIMKHGPSGVAVLAKAGYRFNSDLRDCNGCGARAYAEAYDSIHPAGSSGTAAEMYDLTLSKQRGATLLHRAWGRARSWALAAPVKTPGTHPVGPAHSGRVG